MGWGGCGAGGGWLAGRPTGRQAGRQSKAGKHGWPEHWGALTLVHLPLLHSQPDLQALHLHRKGQVAAENRRGET